MRLRNIPGADEVIKNSKYVIQNPMEQKGKWILLFCVVCNVRDFRKNVRSAISFFAK